jgi:hypothetical protein
MPDSVEQVYTRLPRSCFWKPFVVDRPVLRGTRHRQLPALYRRRPGAEFYHRRRHPHHPGSALGYAHELLSNARLITVATVSGANFLVTGVRPTKNIVTAGIGLSGQAMRNTLLYASYDATLRTGNTAAHNFSAGLRIRF